MNSSSVSLAPWWRRWLLRAGFIYTFLFATASSSLLFGVFLVQKHIDTFWNFIVLGFAQRVFDMKIEPMLFLGSSSDTRFHYMRMLVFLLIAFVGAALWSTLDRKGRTDAGTRTWFPIITRYFVGAMLLCYGWVKVFPLQFPEPHLQDLVRPFGEMAPMMQVWRFMGSSPVYTMFGGWAEVIPGLLLFFRRTQILGALGAVAVMTNVVMINFCYDIPIKLLSGHLLLMSIVLVAMNSGRLLRFFVFNLPVEPVKFEPHFSHPKAAMAARIVKGVLVVAWGFSPLLFNALHFQTRSNELPELYGIYEVETFMKDGEPVPPLTTDGERWEKMIVDRRGRVFLYFMDGERTEITMEREGPEMTLTPTTVIGPGGANGDLPAESETDSESDSEIEGDENAVEDSSVEDNSVEDSAVEDSSVEDSVDEDSTAEDSAEDSTTWIFKRPHPDTWVLTGTGAQEGTEIKLQKKSLEEFPLVSRGLDMSQEEAYLGRGTIYLF